MTDLHVELGNLSGISDGDQRSASIVNIAADLVSYHARLSESRMPKALVSELTMQAGHFLWGGSGCECDG